MTGFIDEPSGQFLARFENECGVCTCPIRADIDVVVMVEDGAIHISCSGQKG